MFDKLFFTKNGQISESLALGIFLTLAGGFQDAYSYNVRDHVFANAQTGNIVLLGQNLASGNLMHALRYLLPLAAFFLGVYLTEWIKHFYKNSVKIHWRQIVLIIEILILGITGFLQNEPTLNVIANIMLSFACAMQVDTFRKFRSIPCATTMCIGNMRSATEYLCLYHVSKDPAMKYKSMHCGFIILVFAVGAAFGASCSAWFGVKAIWIAMAMQVVGFFMMFAHQDIEAFEKKKRSSVRHTPEKNSQSELPIYTYSHEKGTAAAVPFLFLFCVRQAQFIDLLQFFFCEICTFQNFQIIKDLCCLRCPDQHAGHYMVF